MCITRAELNKTVSELKSLKMLKEETEAEIRALENSIIEFLNDTEECETTDKKGKPIRQYIGTDGNMFTVIGQTFKKSLRQQMIRHDIQHISI